MKVNNGVADVGNLVEIFNAFNDHVADDARRNFGAAHALQGAFNLAHQAFDVGGRDGALGTGDADAAHQFFAVKFLAGAIRFNDEWCGENGTLDGAEALVAVFAFPAAANATATFMRGIQNFRFFVLTIWTAHRNLQESGWQSFLVPTSRGFGHQGRMNKLPPHMGVKVAMPPVFT